jgi:hypothetical protein
MSINGNRPGEGAANSVGINNATEPNRLAPTTQAIKGSNGLAGVALLDAALRYASAGFAVIAAVGVAAGLALWGRRPAAVVLAKGSLVLSAAMDLFVYATPYAPSNRTPGTTPYFAAASLIFYGGWLAYLIGSKRVRATFGE